MWYRYELKGRAKGMLRKCFWAAVVVCLISAIFSEEFALGRGSSGRSQSQESEYSLDSAKNLLDQSMHADSLTEGVATVISAIVVSVLIGVNLAFMLIGIIIAVVVGGPVLVGSKYFFMKNREDRGEVGMIFYGFRSGKMGNIILTTLAARIKVILWGFLLIIPGIIKNYEYRMIPYILSENPGIGMKRAFGLSREMMYGQKWEAFLLDLSFLPWYLLGVFTFGIVNIFYVNPYIAATNAELYAVLREDALKRGVTNRNELPGFSKNGSIL